MSTLELSPALRPKICTAKFAFLRRSFIYKEYFIFFFLMKNIVSIVLVLTVAVGLVGCGGDPATELDFGSRADRVVPADFGKNNDTSEINIAENISIGTPEVTFTIDDSDTEADLVIAE
jgi:hypothetical protein